MKKTSHIRPADLRALARLATDATLGIVDLVEDVHHNVLHPARQTAPVPRRTRGITGLVYGAVRGATRVLGDGADAALARLVPLFGERASSPQREAVLAALNGILGDHMLKSGNSLAIRMQMRRGGQPLKLERAALSNAIPQAGGKIVVLLHGLCMNDLQWKRQGHSHGAALERDFGYTALYLHYNTGLHVSSNGRTLAALLEQLVEQWPQPVEELVLVCHSMGGLVARSACHYAAEENLVWLPRLKRLVCMGTPHHGAPLERIGNWVDTILQAIPYVAPFARLGMLRSAGITDLRHGNLLDADWEGRNRFVRTEDMRSFVPLPAGVRSYAMAAMLGKDTADISNLLLGDGLVPLDSALGRHADPERTLPFPASHLSIVYETGHLDLLGSPRVYEQLREWFVAPDV
ncbi:triacylglycerol lipase [Noviherbaspirillum sp. UKPF54]|uniref:esterase/lipase family protein n=1 Tax=Noviherbaspirillum sp. UKPF54 TaxID=2601898 RepID=UPI0011B107AA|nr:alpha/beta fold hydrolase [Noviherbaspirillum sp. UKPF54]QDZ29785.1 alpha/beta fold hydrolase [Noviherbaspirillum sp. UKPF54]